MRGKEAINENAGQMAASTAKTLTRIETKDRPKGLLADKIPRRLTRR
jgi:hypothetical protein